MKVSEQEVRDAIVTVLYHNFVGTTVTVCVIVLDNGFTAVGHSACVDPAEYNEIVGRDIAHKRAFDQAWALLGFRLAEKLATQREG